MRVHVIDIGSEMRSDSKQYFAFVMDEFFSFNSKARLFMHR